MIRNIVATLFRMFTTLLNRNLGQNFLDFFKASGKNCASLSIIPLSLTGVHTKNGYDVNKKLNLQNSKEHWLYL